MEAKLKTFEDVALPHLDAAHNLARWLTGNAEDAEDIVQEAFLRAYRFFDGHRGGDAKAWVLTIVRNTFLTWRRREERSRNSVPFDAEKHGSAGPGGEPADTDGLRGCIEALPPEFREAILLREFEEMSYQEIGEVAGVPAGTVMSRLSRARKRLEECVRRKAGRRS
jgi:RNA polymerase sigma-70 factor, ECF subfamily